jgi:hypothetical protein
VPASKSGAEQAVCTSPQQFPFAAQSIVHEHVPSGEVEPHAPTQLEPV